MDRAAALLLQGIPVAALVAGGCGAFLATAIPGLSLGRLGATDGLVERGLQIGAIASAVALFATGVTAIAALRWFQAPRRVLRDAAIQLVLGGILGSAAAFGGAVFGAALSGAVPVGAGSGAAAAGSAVLWPVVAVSASLAGALALLAFDRGRPVR